MKNNLFSIFNNYSDKSLFLSLSEKKEGTMKISDNLKTSKENRESFLNKLGINPDQVVSAGLVHNNKVEIVSKKDKGKIIKDTDALLTFEKNLFLSVTVADCLPIFIFDKNKKVVGLVHGGWKSLSKNILTLVIKKMKKEFNSNTEDILAGIGPGISGCHFQVKEDLLKEFKPFFKKALTKREEKMFLDIKKIAEIKLIENGLKKENIEVSPNCTYCLSNKYFSFRREKSGEVKNAMMAIIGIIDKD